MSLGPLPIALLVPPINLIILSFVAVTVQGRWPLLAKIVLGCSTVALCTLSMPFVSSRLIYSLERSLPLESIAANGPSAIVILAGDTSRNRGRYDVGPLTLERVRAGATLHRQTGLPIMVSGGILGESQVTLGDLMARSLSEDFRLSTRWVEARAQSTQENATMSSTILLQENITSIYLVTHAWHMKRAIQKFKNYPIHIIAWPVRFDEVSGWDLNQFVPQVGAWQQSYYAIHEWIGYYAEIFIPESKE